MTLRAIQQKSIIIPGAQKSGTTTLFDILIRHSAISGAMIKEPQFFALERKTILEYFSWYESLFSGKDDKILVDASTFYLYSSSAPRHIKEFFKHPRILVILRDPVKRAYSNYLHMYGKVPWCERRSFNSIINEIEGPDQDSIISSEFVSLIKAIRNGAVDSTYLKENYLNVKYGVEIPSTFDDYLWLYKYFSGSLYSKQVKSYTDLFGDDVKVIFFERLISSPEETIGEIFKFIGIEPEGGIFEVPHSRKTRLPRNRICRWILYRIIKRKIPERFSKILLKYMFTAKPELPQEQYLRGRELLSQEYDYWFSRYDGLEQLWTY